MKFIIKSLLVATFAILLTMPVNAASSVYKGYNSSIDTSDVSSKGVVSLKILKKTKKTVAVTIEKSGTKYQYFLDKNGKEEDFPLTMGNGEYTVKILEHITGNRYAVLQTQKINVKLKNEFVPYLNSNQYVEYKPSNQTIKKAASLVKNKKTDLDKINALYEYVSKTIKYDNKKAATVKSGYVPTIDTALKSKKGICFDYSAVLGAMLRSQGIPTRLVTGYVAPNNAFHAWNEIYTKEKGWIKTASMKFNGKKWEIADSTFTASVINKDASKNLIGNGTKYTKSKQY